MTLLSFKDLATTEPRLLDLEDAVRSLCADNRMQQPGIDAFIWSAHPHGLKRQLNKLVGWGAENPALRTEAHWHVGVKHFFGLLEEINGIACGQLNSGALRPRTETDLTRSRSEAAARALAEVFMQSTQSSPEGARSTADLMPEYLRGLRQGFEDGQRESEKGT